ncbi:MAG TPA: transcriptional repressor LexA [Pseudomonadota bacterium]|nr:transcriptional repressor LexA [Xanthomonadales bacterium]HQW81432.1 transcriptional repressor LexA [Pseudomonadota bacterium]
MNEPMSPRQKDVLDLIVRSIAERGYPPTRPEISAALGASSPNAAEQHLRALERKGYIEILPVARGIRVLPGSRSAASRSRLPPRSQRSATPRTAANAERILRLPLVGRVAAGAPILAEQSIEDEISLDPQLFTPRPDFLLRVRGDSMRDAGIHDGDFVAVARSGDAVNGQIVVARINDEATVKTFERKGTRIRLLPANPDYAPIDVDDNLVIEGRVVGVIRRSL